MQCPVSIKINSADLIDEEEAAILRSLGYIPYLAKKEYGSDSEYLKNLPNGEMGLVFERSFFNDSFIVPEDNSRLSLYYASETEATLVYVVKDGFRHTDEGFLIKLPKCMKINLTNIPESSTIFDFF